MEVRLTKDSKDIVAEDTVFYWTRGNSVRALGRIIGPVEAQPPDLWRAPATRLGVYCGPIGATTISFNYFQWSNQFPRKNVFAIPNCDSRTWEELVDEFVADETKRQGRIPEPVRNAVHVVCNLRAPGLNSPPVAEMLRL